MGRELVLELAQSLCSVVTPWDRGFTASALAAGAECEGKTHLEMEDLKSDFSKRQRTKY